MMRKHSMDDPKPEARPRSLTVARSRRGLTLLLGGLALVGPLGRVGLTGSVAKKKRKKKPACRPAPSAAVVASYCFHGNDAGSGGRDEIGQPFIALREGRLDRLEVTAGEGPGGEFALEIRDLNQGAGISSAPVLAAATVILPVIARGGKHEVTARFATDAVLTAGFQYAVVIRQLRIGDGTRFQKAFAAGCFGPGDFLFKMSNETTFTSSPGEKLEHTVYVVP
jgi:hypothetical protein